jgi:AraC-like DNA-binding protein
VSDVHLRRLGAWLTADFRVHTGYTAATGIEVLRPKAPDALGDPFRPEHSVVDYQSRKFSTVQDLLATSSVRRPRDAKLLCGCCSIQFDEPPGTLDDLPPAAVILAATRSWALARLDEPLTRDDLGDHAGMSVRTLTRRFQVETGLSPLQWLLHQRIGRAPQLLEATDLPKDRVADRWI